MKKFIRNETLMSQNFKKVLRKSQGSSSTVHLFYVPEIDISSFFANSRTKIKAFAPVSCIWYMKTKRYRIRTTSLVPCKWRPNKYRVTHFSQFIPAKVKKILRKSKPQFREKLRKLRLRKSVFLIKKIRVFALCYFLRTPDCVKWRAARKLSYMKKVSHAHLTKAYILMNPTIKRFTRCSLKEERIVLRLYILILLNCWSLSWIWSGSV